MASVVEICNLALGHIRAGSINDLNEPSVQAQQCKLRFPILRDALIRGTPWAFAHKVAPLALLDDNSFDVFNWVYAYKYPSDCLMINRLMLNAENVSSTTGGVRYRQDLHLQSPDLRARVEFEIINMDNNRVIAANDAGLRISYRARVTDPNIYDFIFIQALSYMLASELAIPIVGGDIGRAMRQENFQIYQGYLAAATSSNNNESSFSPPRDSEFITVRG